MPLINYIDGPNRLIYLDSSTVNSSINPIDIYKEMRTLRANDENLRKYDVFLSAFGNIPKGGGKFTERYIVENSGTRIVPYDSNSFITIIGTIITDTGGEGIVAFDRTSLINRVDINYIPPQVEIIEINTGSGITEQDKLDIADRVWDENNSEHILSGTTGESLASISGITFSGISSGGLSGTTDEIAIAVWGALTNANNDNGSFGELLSDLITKANENQHSLNVQTEMLKEKPNNP